MELAPLIHFREPIMFKTIITVIAIVALGYMAMGVSASKQTHTSVERSIGRIQAAEAAAN
jgi:hypothetical protein